MTDSALKDRLTASMKEAMKAQLKERLSTIRMALAALKQIEVDERVTLDDARVLAVLEKLIKQRRDAVEQFRIAKRQDLVDKESAEIVVLQEFLPAALTEAELAGLITAAIAETGASSARDMGTVMNWLRPRIAGRAEMGQVSGLVKKYLG